jgi:hypothetical protein
MADDRVYRVGAALERARQPVGRALLGEGGVLADRLGTRGGSSEPQEGST